MSATSDTTTQFATPAGGWDPHSIVDFYKAQGIAPTPQLLGGAFQTAGLGNSSSYTGSAAQNMALLTKLKGGYTGTTTANTISGSPSVQQGTKLTSAMGAASSALSPNPAPTNPASPPDPNIAAMNASTTAAISQIQNDTQTQINDLTTSFTTSYAQLQKQKTSALAAASAEYARANPYGSGSDKEEFLSSIGSNYDTQLQAAQDSYQQQKDALTMSMGENIQNITAQSQANILNYQQQQFTNQVTLDKLGISQEDMQVNLDKLDISKETLGIASQKLGLDAATILFGVTKAANPDAEVTDPGGALNQIESALGINTATTKTSSPSANADAVYAALSGYLKGLEGGGQTSAPSSGNSPNSGNTGQSITINGTQYTVGQTVTNSQGQSGIVNADGTITPQ